MDKDLSRITSLDLNESRSGVSTPPQFAFSFFFPFLDGVDGEGREDKVRCPDSDGEQGESHPNILWREIGGEVDILRLGDGTLESDLRLSVFSISGVVGDVWDKREDERDGKLKKRSLTPDELPSLSSISLFDCFMYMASTTEKKIHEWMGR